MSLSVMSPSTTSTSLRAPAWLLVGTLAAFVAYVAFAIATISKVADTSATLTPGQIDDLGASWMAVHLTWMVPPVLAAVALTLLSRRLGTTTRFVPVLAAVALALAMAYLVVNGLAYGSDAATWGQNELYPWSYLLSISVGWLGVLPATLLVTVALARAGIARRSAWTLTVLVGLYWAFDLLTYLPVILGPATLAAFEGGLPPFLLGIFWAVLGGSLLKSRVTSEA